MGQGQECAEHRAGRDCSVHGELSKVAWRRTLRAVEWLAQQAQDGHGDVWDVQTDGPRQALFRFEHNGRAYAATVEDLGAITLPPQAEEDS